MWELLVWPALFVVVLALLSWRRDRRRGRSPGTRSMRHSDQGEANAMAGAADLNRLSGSAGF